MSCMVQHKKIKVIGRFHPVIVHLPIGILLIAVLFYFLSTKQKFAALQPAVKYSLLIGTIAAALSCITGFLLQQNGEYDASVVSKHQWLGIVLTVLSAIAYYVAERKSNWLKWILPVIALLITITGHLGGTLTHGEGYLFSSSGGNSNATIKPLANVQQAVVYTDIVQPILQTKCYSCHSTSKQKGKLRLDEPSFILQGGESGKAVVPSNISESEMIKRILLPESNEDHMPPKSKPQLTKAQVQLLHWWVSSGADFTKKTSELNQPAEIKTYLVALQTGAEKPNTNTVATDIPAAPIEKAPDSIVQQLRKMNVAVSPVSQQSNYLSISFITTDTVSDAHLRLLQALSKHIVWLKLSSSKVSDVQMNGIAKLTNLTRLSLDNTAVTDKGIVPLKGLLQLQYLNLSFSKVTEQGVQSLGELKNLKQLFLYHTNISPAGYDAIKKILPNAAVDTGGYKVEFRASDTQMVKQPLKK